MRRRIISLAAAVLSVAVLCWVVRHDWNRFASFTLQEPWLLCFAPGLVCAHIFTTGRLFDVLLSRVGVRLASWESFGLAVLSRAGNYVAPRGGPVVRGWYLCKTRGCALADFLGVTLAGATTNLLLTLALALASLTFPMPPGPLAPNELRLCIGGALLVVVAFVAFAPRLPEARHPRLGAWLRGWRLIWSDRTVIRRSLTCSLGQIAAAFCMTMIEFRLVGSPVTPAQALFISTAGSLHYIFKLTPAGLGIHEAAVTLTGMLVGAPAAATLLTVVLRRLSIVAILIVLAPYFSSRMLIPWKECFGRSRRLSD